MYKLQLTTPIHIAKSLLSIDFACLGEEMQAIAQAGVDSIHVDVGDGHFSHLIGCGPMIVSAVRRTVQLPLQIHLLVSEPDRFITAFPDLFPGDTIIVQQEATRHLHRTLPIIRQNGQRSGVALNPATQLDTLEIILPDVDIILLQAISPGWGGQRFIPSTLAKIRELHNTINGQGLSVEIGVEGGNQRKQYRRNYCRRGGLGGGVNFTIS